MKHDWEWRSFEACLEKVIYTKKLQSSDYLSEGKHPVVSQEEGLISGFWNNDDDIFEITKPLVIFGDHTRVLKYINFNFVLGADGVKILQPIDDIRAKFLYYYLKWFNVPSLGYSRHYKLLKECSVPVPSLSVQQQIVSELDKVNRVIEAKKEQLKELDKLAQSLFYDMFGDPITNDKGWDISGFNDVFNTTTGKLNANAMVAGGQYPFFTCSKEIFYIDKFAFDEEALLLAGNNATANYDVKYYKGKFNAYQRTYVLTSKGSDLRYLKVALEEKLAILQEQSIGGMTKYLTLGILEKLRFLVPPLSLQQTFAQKIEAIEKQKELINQSIKEAQLLFDSRMDYYFGE